MTSEILKDYGLKRIQKSAFMGNLKKYKVNSMIADLKKIVEFDRILVVPLCETDFGNLVSIGKEFVEPKDEQLEFY
jgi:CRISPR-associated protein Cas2